MPGKEELICRRQALLRYASRDERRGLSIAGVTNDSQPGDLFPVEKKALLVSRIRIQGLGWPVLWRATWFQVLRLSFWISTTI